MQRRVAARMDGKIRSGCVAFTVRIGARYYGIEQHDSLSAALGRAREIVARSAVVIRRRSDGRRFSVAELENYLRGNCPACYWDRVPARAFRLCGHPTLTDDETIRSPLHECPGFRPYDNAGKPLASQNQPL
jgi:hypothetical protein